MVRAELSACQVELVTLNSLPWHGLRQIRTVNLHGKTKVVLISEENLHLADT